MIRFQSFIKRVFIPVRNSSVRHLFIEIELSPLFYICIRAVHLDRLKIIGMVFDDQRKDAILPGHFVTGRRYGGVFRTYLQFPVRFRRFQRDRQRAVNSDVSLRRLKLRQFVLHILLQIHLCDQAVLVGGFRHLIKERVG